MLHEYVNFINWRQSEMVMDAQAKFLQKLIKEKTPVAVYLKNGIKLLGILTDTCDEVIFLQAGTKVMIYKKAINTILPASVDTPA